MLPTKNPYFLLIKKINQWLLITLTLFALFIVVLPFLPSSSFTQLIEFIIYFSPRWLLFLALLPSLFICLTYETRYKICIIFCLVVYVKHQDFKVDLFSSLPDGQAVKVLSLNIGGGYNAKYLKSILLSESPDVVLLQEAKADNVKGVFPTSWKQECKGGLCIASKFTFKHIGEFNRKLISGWGNFANYYELSVNEDILPIMNVHLETPRSVLSNAMHLHIDWSSIKLLNNNKTFESSLIKTWVAGQRNFVIAGDFNMVSEERLYQDYFSPLKSVIEESGNGVVYTKYTAWHGVRIDHILVSNDIYVGKTNVLKSIGGDHRAIVTTLYLPQ